MATGTKTAVKEKPAKRPPKTLKERRFVKEYLKSGNATQAVLAAGYDANYESARVIGAENLAKLSFKSVMEKQGLTDEVLVSTIVVGLLQAMKMNEYTGEERPDYQVRHRYLETALKLKGHMMQDRAAVQVNNIIPILTNQIALPGDDSNP